MALGAWRQFWTDGAGTGTRRQLASDTLIEGLNDLPFIIMAVIDLLFFWRISDAYNQFINAPDAQAKRLVFLHVLGSGLADLPFIVMAVADLIFIWRIPHGISQLRQADNAATR